MWERRPSCILWLVGMLFSFKVATSVIYHLDVTIVNRYGKDVRIITTHPNPTHQRFMIPVGGSYQINSTSSARQQIVITAYDQATFIPINIDGKNSVFVFASPTQVSSVYYIPSAPNDTSPTQAPVVSPTDAMSTQTLTDATVSSQGRTDAVTTDSLTDAAESTEVSTEGRTDNATGGPTNAAVSTEYATDAAVPTEDPTTAVSTQGPTDTAKTPGPTEAGVSTVVSTEGPTDNATGGPTNAAVITEYATDAVVSTTDGLTTAVSKQGPTNTVSTEGPTNTVSTEGPTDAVKSDKDEEDGCENYKKYIVGIIVLAILLAVLLIIIACLVYQALRNKGKMKTGILYATPEKCNDDEEINCEGVKDSATYATFKETTNQDELMNEGETGF